jgi:hypothetical protein
LLFSCSCICRMRGSRVQLSNFDWFTGVILQIRETVDAFNEAYEATFDITVCILSRLEMWLFQ